MNRLIAISIIIAASYADANNAEQPIPGTGGLCTNAWYQFIEKKVPTSDTQGHGPDVGSEEWKSVIEFKLGIRNQSDLPSRESEAWCRHIDEMVRSTPPPPKAGGDPHGASASQ